MDRRQFFHSVSAGALAAGCSAACGGQEMPFVARPRATAGDHTEPDWERRPVVTVGPAKADLVGSDHRILQAGIDYMAGLGGGTVRILPGVYRLRNAVRLRANVRVQGSGLDSVLIKEASVGTRLAASSDWYEREITLADASGFEVGDGVVLRGRRSDPRKFTLLARNGNRFRVDQMLTGNLWLDADPTATTLFALVDGYRIDNAALENICLDGNAAHNEFLNGNHVGCVFLRECNRVELRKVIARNFNGDGLSWQLSHDVRVEDCHCHDNAGFGAHTGSGSKRSLMAGNRLERNDIGLFFCWGAQGSLAENNIASENKTGISAGHADTDNVIRSNRVLRSEKIGIHLRQEDGEQFTPDRNRLEANEVIDSGGDEGVAIEIEGRTRSIALVRNVVQENRGPARRIGIRISAQASEIVLNGNRISGVATQVLDLRKS